jgi:hypothetical protein
MDYFESLRIATGRHYKAVLCQQLDVAKSRHLAAIMSWISGGTEADLAEMIDAVSHIESIEGAIAKA